MTKRVIAILLTAALSVASALPVLGTRMLCGPSMRSSDALSAPNAVADPSCAACPDRAEPATSAALTAGSCCRVAPVDETNAMTATLSSGSAPAPNDGRAFLAAAVPSPVALAGAALAATRSLRGSPPTVSPPTPTRSTILRN